jgi:anti-sigma-K factor RskA
MKHDQPQLIDALASEYVLGTLRGAARGRFERWMAAEWHVASRVRAWEVRLMPLALRLPPLEPSAAVWPKIEARIAAEAPRMARRRPALRALAAALALCALFVGVYVVWQLTQPPSLQPIATIENKQGPALWSIELDATQQRLRAVALAGAVPRPGHSFELWALPSNKGAPVSLGVLPEAGQLEHKLSDAQRAALSGAAQLAVSLEPPGGSPTGAPTGPVLYVAPLKTHA